MKAKTIFKGAVAGLMSVSLLLSGMPVMATEPGSTQAPQTEGQPTAPAQEQPQSQPGQPAEESPDVPEQNPDIQPEQPVEETPQEPEENPDVQPEQPAEETPQEPEENPKVQPGQPEGETENPEADDEEADKKDKDKEDSVEDKDREKEDTEPIEEDIPQVFSLDSLPVAGGSIAIDGDDFDWAEVTARKSNLSNVDSWKAAFSPDGGTLYFCYTGSASTEWDYGFAGSSNSFKFTYADGSSGEDASVCINAWKGGAVVKNAFYGDVAGASAAVKNEANGNNAGPYVTEFSVPVSFFHNTDFTVEFGGTSVASMDIQKINGLAAA